MDPYQERTLEDELHSIMNHFHELPSEIVEAAIKKLTNNKKFGGTKDEKLKSISNLNDAKEIIIAPMHNKNKKKLAIDIKYLLNHPTLKLRKNKKEDVSRLYFYIANVLAYFFESITKLRNIASIVDPFIDAYNEVLSAVDIDMDSTNKNSMVILDKEAASREYLQGGGILPSDEAFRTCPFCKHSFVDEPPGNKAIIARNNVLSADYEKKKRDFAVRGFVATVRDNTRSDRAPPLPKFKNTILQCHCRQMNCSDRFGNGSCQLCREPGTIPIVDNNGICACEICTCKCAKAFKVRRTSCVVYIQQLMPSVF